MRKTDVRKWIHAVLDMLPLIVIPVFMVYSHRHTIDSYTVQAEETKVVNFNQLQVLSDNDSGSLKYEVANDGYLHFYGESTTLSYISFSPIYDVSNSKILLSIDVYGGYPSGLSYRSGYDNYPSVNITQHQNIGFASSYIGLQLLGFDNDSNLDFYARLQCFDLTKMFGTGNEPTVEQFNTWYSDSYYPYNIGTKELLHTGNFITYDDTDVGSQFFYTLYNTTDRYFNFGNTFGFNNIYDWLQVNIFNGQAPLSVFVVWNIFLYEFLMDLIFLLYALFMFFIDFCTNLIERFYCSARGGR